MIPRPWSAVRLTVLALTCALLPSSAQASLSGLSDVKDAIPELSNALPRALPGPCAAALCDERARVQPKTRVRGFELDLYCRLGGERGLSCTPRRVWAEEYGGGTSDQSLFTGHYFDTETNLYYAKARYFDPELGRFLSQDSYLGELTEPPSLHRYLYAEGRPTYYTDPDGHSVWSAAWKVIKTGGRISAIWEGIAADIDAMGRTDNFMDQLGLGLSMASELLPVSAHDIVDPIADYQEGNFKNMGRQALARTGLGRTAMSMERAKAGVEQIAEGDVVEGTRRIAEAAASVGQRRPGGFGMQKSKGARPARPSGDAEVVTERRRAVSDDPAPVLQKERVGDDPPPGAAPNTGTTFRSSLEARRAGNANLLDLPPGTGRTPAENAQARRFFKQNKADARTAWEERTGQQWPTDPKTGRPQWAEHPRQLKEGGDPLHVEPGIGPDPNAPHMVVGPDGLTDHQRWGALGPPARRKNGP